MSRTNLMVRFNARTLNHNLPIQVWCRLGEKALSEGGKNTTLYKSLIKIRLPYQIFKGAALIRKTSRSFVGKADPL